jgi:hypothetical protein
MPEHGEHSRKTGVEGGFSAQQVDIPYSRVSECAEETRVSECAEETLEIRDGRVPVCAEAAVEAEAARAVAAQGGEELHEPGRARAEYRLFLQFAPLPRPGPMHVP